MRYLRCSLSLLLACVLLLGHCSISSYALDIDHNIDCVNVCPVPLEDAGFFPVCPYQDTFTSNFSITADDYNLYNNGSLYLTHYVYLKNGNLYGNSSGIGNSVVGSSSFSRPTYQSTYLSGSSGFREYLVLHANGEKLFNKKDTIVLDFVNINNSLNLSTAYNGYAAGNHDVNPSDIFDIYVEVLDVNNVFHNIEPTSVTFSSGSVAGTINAHVEFDLTMDAYRVSLIYHTPLSAYGYHEETISMLGDQHVWNRWIGFYQSQVLIEVSDTDASLGLLNGIIEWLRSIRDGISGIVDSIVSLPSKIWAFISDGLISLFVPSESDMVEYSDKWDELLADRLGLVYESSAIINDFGESLSSSTSSASMSRSGAVINIPSVTVNLAGTPFTFGGYSVPVIPAGFEWIQPYSKTITSIVSVFLFLNGLRRRWDGIIGG